MSEIFTAAFGLVSVLFGAYVGGRYSLLATKKAHENNLAIQVRNEKDQKKAYLLGMKEEAEVVWDLYKDFNERTRAPSQQGLPKVYFLLKQDYFTIYQKNAGLLGKIKKEALRKAIVKLYTEGKALLDMWGLYHEIIEKRQILHQQSQGSLLQGQQVGPDAYEKALTETYALINGREAKCGETIETFNREIDRDVSKNLNTKKSGSKCGQAIQSE